MHSTLLQYCAEIMNTGKFLKNESVHFFLPVSECVFLLVDIDNYAPATLFSETTQFVRNPPTSCSVLRENVTWCVRIAYLDGNIETCVSIDDAQQLVFESTCDAQLLNLERHLSLPSLLVCVLLAIICSCMYDTKILILTGLW